MRSRAAAWLAGGVGALVLRATPLAEASSSASTAEPKPRPRLRLQRDASAFYIPPASESNLLLFAGNASTSLAAETSVLLGVQLGRVNCSRFADGEVSIQVMDNVRGKDCYVVQSLGPPVNESLLELIFLVTTLRRASAGKISVVLPYLGYTRHARGGKEAHEASPVAAADVAKMLTVAGVDRVFTVDVHHLQVSGFFNRVPVDDIDPSGIAVPYFLKKNLVSPCVVSPDHDGVQRSKRFRDLLLQHGVLDASLAVVVDQRKRAEKTEPLVGDATLESNFELVGDVRGKDCIIRDDIMESGRRVEYASQMLRRAGARRIFAFSTHALMLAEGFTRIERSAVSEVVCTNTLPLKTMHPKVQQLSVAALLAETIRRSHNNESISEIFRPAAAAQQQSS